MSRVQQIESASQGAVLFFLTAAALVALANGCGGGSSANVTPPPPPPPILLSSISPIVAMQNSGDFTLTAHGSGFTSSSAIVFNSVSEPTSLVNSTELTAHISNSGVSQPGTFQVGVSGGGNVPSQSLNFFVVPAISMRPVIVSSGMPTPVPTIAVQPLTPKLSFIAAGTGNSAGATAIQVKQGNAANLFLVGDGFTAGTFYMISGNPSDVTVTQPLVADFSTTTDGKPSVNVNISVSPSAKPGTRNIMVTNPAGEISVFVGGLLIASGP